MDIHIMSFYLKVLDTLISDLSIWNSVKQNNICILSNYKWKLILGILLKLYDKMCLCKTFHQIKDESIQ